ncbi:hypothetical protein DH2020_026865 [Rehmannia glutinosa]|uniref:Reverse transcriptase domain-containing protein n=1 Tax=Rehmannia glutinosa TaxID=99300 RepID=A0ABR0VYP9_REHGL
MDYLSRLLKVRTSTLEFNYNPRCGDLKITHLAFADDLIFFSKGDPHSVKILTDYLNDFKLASGLDINSFKSNMFTTDIFGEELDKILDLLNFPLGSLPVRYLGVPLAAQKLNCNHYAPLYDRITTYSNKWTANSLLMLGDFFLLNLFYKVLNVFGFKFSLCSILSLIESIGSVGFSFAAKKHLLLLGLKFVFLRWGGLGIRNVHSWNKALLAKILWNIHSKADSLWVRWVHSFYLKNQSIWDWDPKNLTLVLSKEFVRSEMNSLKNLALLKL